ncbi:hypothetical protein C0995_008306 [Termitomyces sp. Mi166|nr:hypothetical protein C0995_008306 [Termitomyces sp. Mi166\
MEDDEDEEGEATQNLRKELEDFVVLTKFDNKLLASLLLPPLEYYEGDSAIVALPMIWLINVGTQLANILASAVVANPKAACGMAAKAFLEQQGKSSQFFVLEGYKGKGKAKALLGDSKQMGAKQSFKSTELVDSDSDEDEEEDRVRVIKKKCEHVEELTGARKRKEIIELEDEVEIVAPKTPAAGPLHQISKPMVLIPSMPKPIPKLIVALASPVDGPSTAPIVPSSGPKSAAATALSKPTPVKSAASAIKGGFISKDPFMVRRFKLAGTEESGVLIINQVTEVLATQETLNENNKDSNDNEDCKGDDDDSNDDAVMDVDSAKCPEETRPMAPTKAMVTKVEAPVPVPLTKPKRMPFFKLYCTDKHVPFLPSGLQVLV